MYIYIYVYIYIYIHVGFSCCVGGGHKNPSLAGGHRSHRYDRYEFVSNLFDIFLNFGS